jgi:HEPN domain-containing protein
LPRDIEKGGNYSMKKSTEAWLNYAFADLENIRFIILAEHLTNIVAFHSQQAIEKSFKSVLEEFDKDIPKVHNINKLYRLILELRFEIDIDLSKLEKINEVYSTCRYPSELGLLPDGKPSLEEAKEFYDFAQKIYEQVKSILEQKSNI